MLNPAFVFVSAWLFVISASHLYAFDPYSNRFYLYVAIGSSVFVLGVAVSRLFVLRETLHLLRTLRRIFFIRKAIPVYVLAMIAGLLFNAYNRYIMIGPDWWQPERVIDYRTLLLEERETPPFPWVSYLNYFYFSAIPLMMCLKPSRFQKAILYAVVLVYIYISAARASIFTIALIAYFFDWQIRGFRVKLTAVIATLLIATFSAIAIFTGKVDEEHFTIEAYSLAPSHALDQIIQGGRQDRPDTFYTFPFLPLHRLHLIHEQWMNNVFYFTPIPTNVYTIFGPYILDYGIPGSLVWIFAIGILCGAAFTIARKKEDPYMVFVYSMILTLLCLSVFHDHFTSSGYVWASIVLGFLFFPISWPQLVKSYAPVATHAPARR